LFIFCFCVCVFACVCMRAYIYIYMKICHRLHIRFGILMMVGIRHDVFWDMAPCSMVETVVLHTSTLCT
jgi:hypothetical protein